MRNENSPIPRGRQIFGITTPLPPVREKELAPPPTPAEIKAANSGELAGSTRTVEKVGRNRVLKAVLGGGAVVAVGAVAYEAVPAVHRAADSAFLDHLKGMSSLSEASTNTEVFDNTAKEPKITDKNSSYVTLNQFKTMDTKSSYDPATQTFTYVAPFAIPEGVSVGYKKIGSPTSGPDTPLYHEEIGFIGKDGRPAAGVGIFVTEEGWHARLSQGWEDAGENPNLAGNVSLFKFFPEYNKTVWLFITDPSGSLEPHMSMTDTRKSKVKDYENELPSPVKGTIVASTTNKTQQPLIQFVQVYEGKNVTPNERRLIRDIDPQLSQQISGQVLLVKNK